jgi:hypothetical protein
VSSTRRRKSELHVCQLRRTRVATVDESVENLVSRAVPDGGVHVEAFVQRENTLFRENYQGRILTALNPADGAIGGEIPPPAETNNARPIGVVDQFVFLAGSKSVVYRVST